MFDKRTYTLDANGCKIESTEDPECRGTPEGCRATTVDAQCKPLSERISWNCTDDSPRCQTWTYDGAGNLVEQVEDQGCDGKHLVTHTWVYNCE